VTRSYDDWRFGDRELRAFLRVGLELSAEGYEARWNRLSQEPSDGEGPELIDLMEAEVDGLSSLQFDWLLMNIVIRDGVTLYEVFLEKALYEVAELVGVTVVGERSPSWRQIKGAYAGVFRVDPAPKAVERVIALRDLLTHRRGELRTKALQERYDTAEYGFPDLSVRLKPNDVVRHLDTLAKSVARIDQVIFPPASGNGLAPDARERLIKQASWLFVWEES
jgi:hypothetical protein